jgi:hypothetical protein
VDVTDCARLCAQIRRTEHYAAEREFMLELLEARLAYLETSANNIRLKKGQPCCLEKRLPKIAWPWKKTAQIIH